MCEIFFCKNRTIFAIKEVCFIGLVLKPFLRNVENSYRGMRLQIPETQNPIEWRLVVDCCKDCAESLGFIAGYSGMSGYSYCPSSFPIQTNISCLPYLILFLPSFPPHYFTFQTYTRKILRKTILA